VIDSLYRYFWMNDFISSSKKYLCTDINTVFASKRLNIFKYMFLKNFILKLQVIKAYLPLLKKL